MTPKQIIDRMRTTQVIAEWKAAEDFLGAADNNVEAAIELIKATKGNGLRDHEAEHLVYLAKRISFEADVAMETRS